MLAKVGPRLEWSDARWAIWPSILVAALIAALVLPQCFGTIVCRLTPDRIAKMDVATINNSISSFVRARGRLPNQWSELVEHDGRGGPYLDYAHPPPRDPWRRPYIYEPNSADRSWRVLCFGRDGEPG